MRQILQPSKDLGDHKKSRTLFRKALAIYENNPGKGEIERDCLFRNMGGIHLLEGRLEEAQSLIDKSLGILKRHNHPESFLSLESFAELCLKRSKQAAKEGNTIQLQSFKDQVINQLDEALQ